LSQADGQKPRKERKENADRRRRQLLDAARRSILRHGLARTTLATVAEEAGLSQGVAVFYFKSKGGLLTETLRDLYQGYESLWTRALDEAGEDPRKRLRAIVAADFDARACGRNVLPLWFAFWGELRFQAQYDEVAEEFDSRRHAVLVALWRDLLPENDAREAEQLTEWLETLSDGYWQRLHLAPDSLDRAAACRATLAALALMRPGALDSRD
jgi:TetR/AcrR family transcriptional repressor of bet genes